jgi:hypothetical protein
MLMEDYFSLTKCADKGNQLDDKIFIAVQYGRKRVSDGYLDSQLFLQFPCQALLGAFAIVKLAAREFPFERHTHGSISLGGKHFSVIFDNSACNTYDFFAH